MGRREDLRLAQPMPSTGQDWEKSIASAQHGFLSPTSDSSQVLLSNIEFRVGLLGFMEFELLNSLEIWFGHILTKGSPAEAVDTGVFGGSAADAFQRQRHVCGHAGLAFSTCNNVPRSQFRQAAVSLTFQPVTSMLSRISFVQVRGVQHMEPTSSTRRSGRELIAESTTMDRRAREKARLAGSDQRRNDATAARSRPGSPSRQGTCTARAPTIASCRDFRSV